MTLTGSVSVEDRRSSLVELLRSNGSVTLASAAESLNVHPMTIRRDFDYLEREGIARRVRGGAIYVDSGDFQHRQGRELSAKRRIAQKLLPLLPEGSAVSMDASTTIFQFAHAIEEAQGLAVVTNGLATFQTLQRRKGVTVYLTGGISEERNASLVGALAVSAVQNFVFARSFMSTTCVDPLIGTSEPTPAEVDVKRAMAGASAHVVLAVDSSKLGTQSIVRGLDLGRVDLLVTELDARDERLDAYRNAIDIL